MNRYNTNLVELLTVFNMKFSSKVLIHSTFLKHEYPNNFLLKN